MGYIYWLESIYTKIDEKINCCCIVIQIQADKIFLSGLTFQMDVANKGVARCCG